MNKIKFKICMWFLYKMINIITYQLKQLKKTICLTQNFYNNINRYFYRMFYLTILSIIFDEKTNSVNIVYYNKHKLVNYNLIKALYISLYDCTSFNAISNKKSISIRFSLDKVTLDDYLIVDRNTNFQEFLNLIDPDIINALNYCNIIKISVDPVL